MVLESVGSWGVGKILNYGLDTLKSKFLIPEVITAFDKACSQVIQERSDGPFDKYSAQALCSSVDIPEEQGLLVKLEKSFLNNDFPTPKSVAQIVFECWITRKDTLSSSNSADFFLLSEADVRPIIDRISDLFFIEISQLPGLKDPYIIKALQVLNQPASENPGDKIVNLQIIKEALYQASASLFSWPTTLGNNQQLERSEVQNLFDRIDTTTDSSTILLGPPGSGKSALLSRLGQKLKDAGVPVLAIKADKLPSSIDGLDKLTRHLSLPIAAGTCLTELSKEGKVVLIVDQLDALSEIVDRKSERLNILLSFIESVAGLKNTHVVSSSRLFEFKHDTRLNTIQAEQRVLKALSWEQVQSVLSNYDIDDHCWSEEAKIMLKTPLHLKVFIDLWVKNTSTDISLSLQGFLENLWQQRVLNRSGASGKNTLVNKLAIQMTEGEVLWLPRVLADTHLDAFDELVRQDILMLDENGLKIGFRHQTYFDFVRARYFAQGDEKLSDYVIGRQDGLFVRPMLLSSLEYLRGVSLGIYQRELLYLWNNPSLRYHLRLLIVEFLSSLSSPNDEEIRVLLPIFSDDLLTEKALIAMAGSPGWFDVLKKTVLSKFMSKDLETARMAVAVLVSAMSFDQSGVLGLVHTHWLSDPKYDAHTLHIFQFLKDWNEKTVDMVCKVARRTASWAVAYLAEIAAQLAPDFAPKIVRADLDRRLIEAEQKDSEKSIKPPPSNASREELIAFYMLNDPQKNIKGLLENHTEWYDLSLIAETAPGAFLEHVWPWLTSILERVNNASLCLLSYSDDYCYGTDLDNNFGDENQPVSAIMDAIILLSETEPASFLEFYKMNKNSDLLTVHRFLCKGLEKIASTNPKAVFQYLIQDPRRLSIGDDNDRHRESCKLISSIARYLTTSELKELENKIIKWAALYRYSVTHYETTELRKKRFKRSREYRLRLLRAFPEGCLSEIGARLLAEEERSFPKLRNRDSRFISGGIVGSRMSSDEMLKAKDSDILNLFEELTDSTGWDHPRYQTFERSVGGAIQASRELERLAKENPVRAIKLVKYFKAGQQELAAGAIISGLSESSITPHEIYELVIMLDTRGFSGNHFRTDVARALRKLSQVDSGLPISMLQLMEKWLPDHSDPPIDDIQNKADTQTQSSLVFGPRSNRLSLSLNSGRCTIFESIARGYLFRSPPDTQGLAQVVKSSLAYEHHPDVCDVIALNMQFLYNGDKHVATDLVDQFLSKIPIARDRKITVRLLMQAIRYLDDYEIVNKWINLYKSTQWALGGQAFGELLMWHLFHNPGDTHAYSEYKTALTNKENTRTHQGIAFAAAYSWSQSICQDFCTSTLLNLADSEDQDVCKAISKIFLQKEQFQLNDKMRRIIKAVVLNDVLLTESSINLVENLLPFTSIEPDLVFDVCDRVFDVLKKDSSDEFVQLADPLVSISLTLHRMESPYRERGLSLFEKLSESNILEARQALEELDRRPIRASYSSKLPRRKRRIRRV